MTSTDTVPTTQTPANSLSSAAQNPPSSNSAASTDPDDAPNSAALNDPTLPEQHHAGHVGYGPNFRTGPTLEDKISGLKDELKGKLKHDPALVAHGREVASGEARRKALTGEDEPNPFQSVDEDEKRVGREDNEDTEPDMHAAAADSAPPAPASGADPVTSKGAVEQAATAAPEGTRDAEKQRADEAQDVKQVDARN